MQLRRYFNVATIVHYVGMSGGSFVGLRESEATTRFGWSDGYVLATCVSEDSLLEPGSVSVQLRH